jgi:hypothetical protein
VSPFGDRDDFRIVIDSDEFPDCTDELTGDFLDPSPYPLEGSFDGDDGVELRVGKRRWEGRWPGPGVLTCGPVKVRLYAFDLDTTSLAAGLPAETDLHSIAIQGERRRTVDLDVELREAVRLVEERSRRHGVRLSVKSPPGSTLARAEIRPENVRRILLLLFENALQSFGAEKDRKVEIKVWARGDRTGFDCSDNGPGIPTDRAEDVFLPHYTTRAGAAGMGLTIVREICRSHGGEAFVVARDGRGTTVRVELKRKQARATVSQPL